jgi:hypothetical protein
MGPIIPILRVGLSHAYVLELVDASTSPLNFFTILGIKSEKMKRPTEKKTLKDINSPQFPEAQTPFRVAKKNMRIKVPTIIPSPVPKK